MKATSVTKQGDFYPPYKNLMSEMLYLSMRDLISPPSEFERQDARAWLESETCELVCDVIGINYSEITKKIKELDSREQTGRRM
jgi:hypothetical protein